MKKITKREINSITKNRNILVGVEFEFYLADYLEDYSKYTIMGIDYNTLHDQWSVFLSDLETEKNKLSDKMKFPDIPDDLEKYLIEYLEEVDLDELDLNVFKEDPEKFVSAIIELEPSSFIMDPAEDDILDIVTLNIQEKIGINVIRNNKPSKEGDS